jgi:hypothetical protein
MSEMVERAAAAIAAIYNEGGRKVSTPVGHELATGQALVWARAAIEAMREPTEAMQADGRDALLPYVNRTAKPVPDQWFLARESYSAMIDAALKD